MGQLEQAKKEAKRLYALAKANKLVLPNLSAAREVVALLNGYQNWHECEEVLKKKDIRERVSPILNNKETDYYLGDMPFNVVRSETPILPPIIFQAHTPVVAGTEPEGSGIFSKKKDWLLDSYPAVYSAPKGSGKTECMLSLVNSYIKNREGVVYITGYIADNYIYEKIFSSTKHHKSLDNLYYLNSGESFTHSIDPINPMRGYLYYFENFFGVEIGRVIHAILELTHQKGQLMDIDSLESVLMFNNLVKCDAPEVRTYLESIKHSVQEHAQMCTKAREVIIELKKRPDLYTVAANVVIESIFLERKILVVAADKLLGSLVVGQLSAVESKYRGIHMQNVIMDAVELHGALLEKIDLRTTDNNYVFGVDSLVGSSITDYIVDKSRTTFVMKTQERRMISDAIKLKMINSMKDFSLSAFGKLPYKTSYLGHVEEFIQNQKIGHAVVFCQNKKNVLHRRDTPHLNLINHNYNFYVVPVVCFYFPIQPAKVVHLVTQSKRLISIE